MTAEEQFINAMSAALHRARTKDLDCENALQSAWNAITARETPRPEHLEGILEELEKLPTVFVRSKNSVRTFVLKDDVIDLIQKSL